jgi:hypothetical protein
MGPMGGVPVLVVLVDRPSGTSERQFERSERQRFQRESIMRLCWYVLHFVAAGVCFKIELLAEPYRITRKSAVSFHCEIMSSATSNVFPFLCFKRTHPLTSSFNQSLELDHGGR